VGFSVKRFLENMQDYPEYDFYGHIQNGLFKVEVYKIDPDKPLRNLYKLDKFNLIAVKRAVSDSNILQMLCIKNPIESPVVTAMTIGNHVLNYLGPVYEYDSTGIAEKTQYFRITGIQNGVIFVSLIREECKKNFIQVFLYSVHSKDRFI
jgi:hypothetical protein